jgi:hypothetical protein
MILVVILVVSFVSGAGQVRPGRFDSCAHLGGEIDGGRAAGNAVAMQEMVGPTLEQASSANLPDIFAVGS